MDPRLTYIQILSRGQDAPRHGVSRSRGRSSPVSGARRSDPLKDTITLRHASSSDEHALRQLAELDSRPTLEGPVLLAEIDGRLAAAVAVDNGAAVADPFERTVPLVELLKAQAKRESAGVAVRSSFLTRLAARAGRPGEARAA